MDASCFLLGKHRVDKDFLKQASRTSCGEEAGFASLCDPQLQVKLVCSSGEAGLVYEWGAQDRWRPIHFTKAKLQILGFSGLQLEETSKNRTSLRLLPGPVQLSLGSQAWDSKASRCKAVKWDAGARQDSLVLPSGFREDLACESPHVLMLNHDIWKVSLELAKAFGSQLKVSLDPFLGAEAGTQARRAGQKRFTRPASFAEKVKCLKVQH
eukprot:TRINITY_DN31598_c0_g1_i1.p1 TRINITY_DN31598_c0_g1~~TRINITY_DN31598_c0_g1_i1.p1  ORF type:complete len:220 (+),score=55.19 TRINITY_DN31598_c0_g1_i1:28-660(+)